MRLGHRVPGLFESGNRGDDFSIACIQFRRSPRQELAVSSSHSTRLVEIGSEQEHSAEDHRCGGSELEAERSHPPHAVDAANAATVIDEIKWRRNSGGLKSE